MDSAIQFENAYKTLKGVTILNGIDLTIPLAQTVAIVGPSGTGKSVLLRHIIGLHQLDYGKLTVLGQNMETLNEGETNVLRRQIGYLFQSGALFAWMNLFENVALPLQEHSKYTISPKELEERVCNALELVGLVDHRNKFPDEISGGMRKRAGLARAIVTNPKILLCDEPTSGLDPMMSRHIDQLLIKLNQKIQMTTILVTHDLVSAFNCASSVVMLYQGKVAEYCSVDEFRQSSHPIVVSFIESQVGV